MDFIRSVVVQNVTPAADGVYTYDLPVNAISHINLTIMCLNLAAVEATPEQICAALTDIKVLHRGTSIFQMSAADLLAYNMVIFRKQPIIFNQAAAINSTRALGLMIPFGRHILDPDEAFPQTRAGNLQLQLTVDILTAAITGVILQIEVTEIVGASPSRYLKATTLTHNAAAVGDTDIDLPIGNTLVGLLMYGTTIPLTIAWLATIEGIKLLANNTERLYSFSNWESLHSDLINRCGMYPGYIPASVDDDIAHYALADFDPNDDGKYFLESAPLSALKLRVTAGDVLAIRVIPIELVSAR